VYLDGHAVAVQYSNWQGQGGYPYASPNDDCIYVSQNNQWLTLNCSTQERYVCQS